MNGIRLLALLASIAASAAIAAIPVTTAAVGELLQHPVNSAPATVIARNHPSLAAEIDARIEEIPVRVGDIVEPGALLVRLDCRRYDSLQAAAEAGMEQLTSELEFSSAQLRRAEGLKQKKGISDEGVEERRSQWQSYSARHRIQQEAQRQAALQVQHCDIQAPFRAVVVERLANRGSFATVGTPILKLVQLDDIEVSARLRDREAESLLASKELWFEHLAQRYRLVMRKIVPVIDARTRTREARLIFAEASAPIGAAGRLRWTDGAHELPANYLVRRGGELGIFLADGNKAMFHPLPGAIEGQPAVVELPAETLLIIEGRQRLGDGDTIAIQRQQEISDARKGSNE
ncbi:MAG: efflux RND transporter periplasmic adaptor subunit [Pseudomonadota bacterium]